MSRVLLLCWRDSAHPQGGGSERYLENVASYLAAQGHTVVLRTSRPPRLAAKEHRDGYVISRGGGRFTVYPRALLAMVAARWGRGPLGVAGTPDVVVDTQNGVPFFACPVAGCPVVVLVHHVHREQWPVAGIGLAQIGWWIESWLSPKVHARCQYVTVSLPSAQELQQLGVTPDRIAVVRNGLDPAPELRSPAVNTDRPPRIVVLSRLVPHKQIEDALATLVALKPLFPDIVLDVIGDGWWAKNLHAQADTMGLRRDIDVVFHGHVPEREKHQLLSQAQIHLMPSRKEGWGLAVSEAAQHGVPTIGYRHSGGLLDSIDDGVTGVLVSTSAEMIEACTQLLSDESFRERLGTAARQRAAELSWEATGSAMEEVLGKVRSGEFISGVVTASQSRPDGPRER